MKSLDCKETVECPECKTRLGLSDGDLFVLPINLINPKRGRISAQCIACQCIFTYFSATKLIPVSLNEYGNKKSVVSELLRRHQERVERCPEEFTLVYVTKIFESNRGNLDTLDSVYVCVDYYDASRIAKEIPLAFSKTGDDCTSVYSEGPQTYAICKIAYGTLKLDKVVLSEPPEHYGLFPFVRPQKTS